MYQISAVPRHWGVDIWAQGYIASSEAHELVLTPVIYNNIHKKSSAPTLTLNILLKTVLEK